MGKGDVVAVRGGGAGGEVREWGRKKYKGVQLHNMSCKADYTGAWVGGKSQQGSRLGSASSWSADKKPFRMRKSHSAVANLSKTCSN